MSHALLLDVTQPQTLSVEKEELLARAAELEAPLPEPPSENPQAPCGLGMVTTAAEQLRYSAEAMRERLGWGERERRRLAESLRNAAKAYEEVDEDAAHALNTGTSVSAVTPGLVDADLDLAMLNDTPVAATAASNADDYTNLKVRTGEIDYGGDHGASFDRFADAWEAHQRTLQEAAHRFRPFQDWDGDAAYAVEAHFDQQRTWLYQMADLCGSMARQARDVTSAHRWALEEHIWHFDGAVYKRWTLGDIQAWEYRYTKPEMAPYRAQMMQTYASMQEKSDEVVDDYFWKAGLPLPPMRPPTPPRAYRINPPQDDDGDGSDRNPYNPNDRLPFDENLPVGMPSTPSAGAPSTPDAALTDALTDAVNDAGNDALAGAPGLPMGSGVKPASLGGGGAGAPSMPLQPPVDSESAQSRAAAARNLAGLGRATPGAAMGGPGMGMAPTGAPGAGQGQSRKAKRGQDSDEPLYQEDRPWTTGVIGMSPANGNPRSKDSK
jgi:hypothetical protein